jgi:hypothetical protein
VSGQHARLSASSAHRWLPCPGSVGGDSTSSRAAAEGTFAHDIAAKCLSDASVSPSDFLCKREKVDGHDVECGLEMIEAVQLYVDEMNDSTQPGDQCWIEMPLLEALKTIDKDLGGTSDYVRYRPSTKNLLVADLKYGSGVFVDADDNEQAKLYALGALLEVLKHKLLVADIEVKIVQPRFEGAKPVRSWTFKAVELLDFAADVQEAAERSRQKDAPLVAGEHCKFCPRARSCPELEKRQHALIAAEFSPLVKYDVKALGSALVNVPLVKERIKALEEFAYAEALRGIDIPGFKLVDKRPVRKWKSEGDVIVWAQEKGVDPFAPREVMSPAQLEKKLAENAPRGQKKAAGAVLEPFVEKISSGTALVPITDERAPAKVVGAGDFPALLK